MSGIEPVAVPSDSGRDIIIFGGDVSYWPFEKVSRTGEPKGFIIELENSLADLGNKKPVHVSGTWPDLVTALEDGTIDILPMFISQERTERFSFSRPFFFFKHAIFARPGLRGITAVEDLSDMRIAVESRSYAEERFRAEFPAFDLLLVSDTRETLQAVVDGRADAAVIAAPVADGLIRDHGFKVQRYGMPLWSEGYAFAVRKDRTELAEWVAASFAEMLESGEYDAIFERWKGELEPRPLGFGDVLGIYGPRIALMVGLFILAIAAFLGWRYRLVPAKTGKRLASMGAETGALAEQLDSDIGLPGRVLFSRQVEEWLKKADTKQKRWNYAVFRLTAYDDVVRSHGARSAIRLVSGFAHRLRDREYHAVGYLGRGYFGVLGDRLTFGLGSHVSLDPVELHDDNVESPVICGVTRIPEGADSLDDFAHFAETALSQCLPRHRNWLLYDGTMEPDPLDPRIVRAFRLGETAGLSAFFQPQMDIASGRTVGVETLVRWNHPELGMVPPGKFIPLLEQAGLIGRVTDFILEKAMSLGARLAADGSPVTVSVNLSVHDLMDMNAYDKILACLDWCNCPASHFVVELTETAFAEDPDLVRSTLMRLRRLGVRTSIDDFGTGFASLSYLSEFPADEVKIDRLFVSRMQRSAKDRAIIRSTIALAHELGLIVVAEGVEDSKTLAMLREEGCDQAQGYGISRPLDENALMDFLKIRTLQA